METTNQVKAPVKAYKVVVGYDFSAQADQALEQAISSLKGRPAELHVIFAVTDRSSTKERSLEELQEELSFIVRKGIEDTDGDVTVYAHARLEPPAKAIIKLANEIDADSIFVGTHNRKGLSRLVLGSVAEQVLRHASCSVTVVKTRSDIEEDVEIILEPPCPACVAKREETNGEKWWCDDHSKPYHPPHRYAYRDGVAITRPSYSVY